ncbi:MAG: menaquinone biosynthesis decarboxylase [Phycisphaerae bacterium]|nr:menaquinone biosynthesis decarboxylase [Phycisphaerae bacterium]
MAFDDLSSFVNELDRRGQLKRVTAPVDAELEITEIADRMSKSPAPDSDPPSPMTDPVHGGRGGYALLFENVRGYSMPVLINAYGSYERMRLALGCEDFEALAGEISKLLRPEVPATLVDKIKRVPELVKLAGVPPKLVGDGVCQEHVLTDDANLLDLPAIKCWPDDGGRYITFAGVYTKNPHDGDRNVGMYRVQLFEPKLAAMHWHPHHDGARHFRMYQRLGKRMPVALVFGGESVLSYAATCPLPPGLSELLFAGFLHGRGIELVRCRTIEMEVPANAEIVVEGYIDPGEKTMLEGPFGDHTGFYSLADQFPRFHVTAITHRTGAIYPTTIVGKPPMEDYYLGKATERIFLPMLKTVVPDIIDYHLPMFGAFHNCVFIKIRKEYAYQARKVMHAIWGAGQMMFCKFIVVVDEHVDVHDEQEVLFQVGANVDPRRDTVIVDGPLDILDHAAPACGAGSKMGIDATRKIAGEGEVREWPDELRMSEEIVDRVTRRWSEYGLS